MNKMQIILSVVLMVLLLAVSMTIPVLAEDTVQSGVWGDLSWMLNETTGELVISGEGEMNSLVDTPVWGTYASSIKSVVIEEGVKSIGNYAFKHCSNLSSVTIPNSVTSIGFLSFWNCIGLREITIPNTCTYVSEDAFQGCEYINTITIPANAIYAFSFCKLKTVMISNGTTIPSNAFSNQSGMLSIVIPNTITKIEAWAFFNCSSLKSISIPQGVTEIGEQAFQGCKSLESIAIPENVTVLGRSIFLGCKNLKSVVFPQNITEIGENMFDGCESLESFTFSENVESIGNKTFYSCHSLTEIIIPNTVKIGNYALGNCSGLKKLVLSNGVKGISGYALDSTFNIETVTIPTTIISYIPKNNLKTVIFNSGKSIAADAFNDCKTLEAVIFCGSEDEWKALQQDKSWLKHLENVSFTYHNCQWEIADDSHTGFCYECNSEISGEHIWDTGSIAINPTHMSTGLKKYCCTVCQKSKDAIMDKIATHDYDTYIEHDETQHKKICTCGDIVYEDHSYGAWTVVTRATEQSEGKHQKTCDCGKAVSKSIPRLTHEYIDTVISPTCSEQGYTLHTCKNCDHSYKDTYVNVLEHVYYNDKDSTCNNCNALRENTSTEKAETPSDAKSNNRGCNATLANKFAIVVIMLMAGVFYVKEKHNN